MALQQPSVDTDFHDGKGFEQIELPVIPGADTFPEVGALATPSPSKDSVCTASR